MPSAGATLVETAEPTFHPSGTDPGFDPNAEFSAEGTDPGGGEHDLGAPRGRRRAHSITASPIQGSGADIASAVLGGTLAYTLSARPARRSRRSGRSRAVSC